MGVFTPAGARAFLGVAPSADHAAVKKAWRRQALKAHPDKAGGDKERFQRLQDAYRCVVSSQKRSALPAPAPKATAAPRPSQAWRQAERPAAPRLRSHLSEAARLRARVRPAKRLASVLFDDGDPDEALRSLFPPPALRRDTSDHLDRIRERVRWSAEFAARSRDIDVLDAQAALQRSHGLAMPIEPRPIQQNRRLEPARRCEARGPCARAGCPYYRTWHASHCCNNCDRIGTHGPRCHKMARLAEQGEATNGQPGPPARASTAPPSRRHAEGAEGLDLERIASLDVPALAAQVMAMSRAARPDALQALPAETRDALAQHMKALKAGGSSPVAQAV